ncbi:hypothetical protein OZX73_05895 [Bifidobacterium sp. ESL0775]|uniref:hypothetical protein n=1 Tax=Bifidobacterium sp. ESL0775 TaxID=2983230 RepID=UPI0023F83F6C|nr:hypothetical protein [Bifidobacterium sp. ESL0775]WEV68819.1 hypothetical protein OZX73_05895 [Bifidobacterium sp. ESL0775]
MQAKNSATSASRESPATGLRASHAPNRRILLMPQAYRSPVASDIVLRNDIRLDISVIIVFLKFEAGRSIVRRVTLVIGFGDFSLCIMTLVVIPPCDIFSQIMVV